MTIWILWPLVAFGLALFLHGIVMRLSLRVDAVRRFLLVGIPLGGALVVFSILTFGLTSYGFAPILLYAFLCELYIFLFTLVLSSVSVTMLMLLRRAPVAVSALKSEYDPGGMVALRLDRLIQQGFIARNGARIVATTSGMRLQRSFEVLQRFFRHAPQ